MAAYFHIAQGVIYPRTARNTGDRPLWNIRCSQMIRGSRYIALLITHCQTIIMIGAFRTELDCRSTLRLTCFFWRERQSSYCARAACRYSQRVPDCILKRNQMYSVYLRQTRRSQHSVSRNRSTSIAIARMQCIRIFRTILLQLTC